MKFKKPGGSLNKPPLPTLLVVLLLNVSSFGYAETASDQARTAIQNGRYELALSYWEAALPQLEAEDRVHTLLQMAETRLALGQVQEAFRHLETAYNLTEQANILSDRIQVLGLLSDAHLLLRQTDQALAYAEKSTNLARSIEDNSILANALNHLGNAQMAAARYQQALGTYQAAVKLTDSVAAKDSTSKLLINAIHASLALNLYETAVETTGQAISVTSSRMDTYDKAMDLIAIGYLANQLITRGDQNPAQLRKWAYQALNTALTNGQENENKRIQSYAYGHLGELYVSAGQFNEAETLLRKALFRAAEAQAPELLARWHWQLARLMRQKQLDQQALEFYQKAITDLESIQPALIYGYRGDPGSFRNSSGRIYREMVELLLHQSETTQNQQTKQQALYDVERVMEKLKTFELKNYFQDDCVTELQNKIIDTEIDKLAEPATAILYPIVLPDRLVILLSLENNQIKRFDISVTSEELRQTVYAFMGQLIRPGNPRRVRSLGLKLHDWLIKPVAQDLHTHSVDTLVIVADDVLRAVPYAALYDGEDFLVTKYALAITPGLSLTNMMASDTTDDRLLLTGLSEGVQDFNPLPFVTQEITRIATIHSDNELILNQDFKKNLVRQQLTASPYKTVVFATHAYLAADPKQSFLLTYDDKISLDELDQYIGMTRFHDQELDLLVLSACNTARGDERAMLGLAGMAVKSGARSVVASLWSVNDASTAVLMPTFFEQLKSQKISKAKALQLAQKKLLANPLYRHPFYWAAFTLICDWH